MLLAATRDSDVLTNEPLVVADVSRWPLLITAGVVLMTLIIFYLAFVGRRGQGAA